MYKQLNYTFFALVFSISVLDAQEDAIRFFDLETRPVISVLYDQTYKRSYIPIQVPTNIFVTSNQRRTINMAEQIERKALQEKYLIQIYQSRINQQQGRISQNYRTTVKADSKTNTENSVQFRQPYNYQPYGWQNNYYHSSGQWNPSFYQGTSYGRLRANRYMFY